MPPKQPPRVQFDFEPDIPVEDTSLNITIEDDIYNSDSEILLDEEPVIYDTPIVSNDIFDIGDAKKLIDKPKNIKKNGQPRKPMSEEHKMKLAESRKKAVEVRKLKAEERKKAKALENEERELLKQQKVKRVQKLREEVSNESNDNEYKAPSPAPSPAIIHQQSFTREDLEKAQLDAIIKYEALRKSRKEEKKKEEMIKQQQEEMRNKIKRATEPQSYTYRATNSNGGYVNPWDKCY